MRRDDDDYNGIVEQADLDLVLLHWGEELANPVAAGWTNGVPDGAVDQSELDAVLLNWGSSTMVAAATTVPEPGGLLLFAVGSFDLALASRRRRDPRSLLRVR